ncbi:hypothetical protein SD427_04750 [Chryseobacterium sp. JJR-5R]|uniref:hypothetical protein n=1 Tax=Chryseobacterium sp. JJR-5R TaxID=3093923 RepID=UPI002A762553|nr:hypothetical protein [Chryseobacterium sp. JJR-5R]WPO83647.1 hypothetical protein SD427_04750 [Chryseobacterium sp. JJR-5R]
MEVFLTLSFLKSCRKKQQAYCSSIKNSERNGRILKIFFILFMFLCKGQNKENCSKENAYNNVVRIQEVKKAVDQYKKGRQKIIFNIDEGIYNNKKYFIVKEEQEGELHNSVWNIFYVDKKDCSVYYYDTVNGNLLTLDKWRSLGKKTEKRTMEK